MIRLVKRRTRESVTQLLWLLNRILKDESKVAQEADAQAEEEAQEDARQVQVDRRCDLSPRRRRQLRSRNRRANSEGSAQEFVKAHAFDPWISVFSRLVQHHPASP